MSDTVQARREPIERPPNKPKVPPRVPAVPGQLLVVAVGFQTYKIVREAASGNQAEAMRNGDHLLAFERLMGLDVERGVQAAVLRFDWVVRSANVAYVWGYWPPVIAALIALFLLDRPGYRTYRNALLVSGGLGVVTFLALPVAPPRMMPGYVDTVALAPWYVSVVRPGSFANPYAAMPSFHVGWLILAGVALWRLIPSRCGRLATLLPGLTMTFVVLATANHYLIDAVAGVAVALFGLAVARWIDAVQHRHRGGTNSSDRPDGAVRRAFHRSERTTEVATAGD